MTKDKGHRIGTTALTIGTILLVGAVTLLWAWNTVATDLFSLPTLQYKHAVAAELFVVTITATVVATRRCFRSRNIGEQREA